MFTNGQAKVHPMQAVHFGETQRLEPVPIRGLTSHHVTYSEAVIPAKRGHTIYWKQRLKTWVRYDIETDADWYFRWRFSPRFPRQHHSLNCSSRCPRYRQECKISKVKHQKQTSKFFCPSSDSHLPHAVFSAIPFTFPALCRGSRPINQDAENIKKGFM